MITGETMDSEQRTIEITSADRGAYGLTLVGGVQELTLVRRDAGVSEVAFDRRLAPIVARSIDVLADGGAVVAQGDLPPEERSLVCPTCGFTGRFDEQGGERLARYYYTCPGCDTKIQTDTKLQP